MTCTPLIILSQCDSEVYIADSSIELTLNIYKQGSKLCSHIVEPLSGKIFLTDEIIDSFSDLFNTFILRLRDSNNNEMPFIYLNCKAEETETFEIKVKFNDCETRNIKLVAEC